MNYKILCVLCISLLFLTVACCVVSARVEINKPADAGTVSIITYTGNLTNVSEMEDVNVPSPSDGETFTWNDTTGVWESQTATATDTSWRTNWTAYNDTWSAGGTDTWVANYSYYYNKTQIDDNNASVTNTIQTDNSSMNNYVNSNNESVNNYILENNNSVTNTFSLYALITNLVDYLGNWSADKSDYYTSTEVDILNTSQTNYINSNNASVNNYILYVNSTNPSISYEDGWINGTIDNKISDNNDSINNYIVNYTGEINSSVTNTIETNNVSINNWVTSLAYATLSYVDTVISGIGNWTADKVNYYTSSEVDTINTSVTNTFGLYILRTEIVDEVGNWSADKGDYYTSTEVDILNTSQTNYINANNNSIVNTMVPYEGADKNINISFNNFSIGGGTIWWNGSCMIFT